MAKNPYALDGYKVIITHNGEMYSVFTFGGLFEGDEEISERVYETWCKEHNIK
jgi:hypothetical protein